MRIVLFEETIVEGSPDNRRRRRSAVVYFVKVAPSKNKITITR